MYGISIEAFIAYAQIELWHNSKVDVVDALSHGGHKFKYWKQPLCLQE